MDRERSRRKRAIKKAKMQAREDANNKRKKRIRYRFDKTRLLISLILLAFLVTFGVSVKNIVDLKIEQAELRKENSQLLKEKIKLNNELKHINDDNYIEEQARNQLNMIKPGEILYLIDKNNRKDKEN